MCACNTVLMIPKGGGNEFRGIGLVEVLWKAISGIINCRISSYIHFHDALHGFRAGRGTGTVTLKAKPLHNLTATREEVLYSILINLRKAYDALDRDRCLDIMAGYGGGPRTLRILWIYWVCPHMEAKAGGIMGLSSRATTGRLRGTPCHPLYLTRLLMLLSGTGWN